MTGFAVMMSSNMDTSTPPPQNSNTKALWAQIAEHRLILNQLLVETRELRTQVKDWILLE